MIAVEQPATTVTKEIKESGAEEVLYSPGGWFAATLVTVIFLFSAIVFALGVWDQGVRPVLAYVAGS